MLKVLKTAVLDRAIWKFKTTKRKNLKLSCSQSDLCEINVKPISVHVESRCSLLLMFETDNQ